MRCEPETVKTEKAADNETLRLSPWGTKTASLHEQPWQEHRAGVRPETEIPGGRDGRASRHGTGTKGSRGEPGAIADPQQGLGIHTRGAVANLACCPSPDLKSYAGVQPVKDNLGRSDVAFARNGFTEGAQNSQRVGMRSPVGAPDNWAVRDVLTKERVQMGPIVLMFGLDPRLSAVSTSLRRMRGADGDIQGSVGVA